MSWAELKEFIASISVQMQEADRRIEESRKETDRRMQEADRRIEESRKEFDRRMQEADRQMQESRKEFDRRIEDSRKETEQVNKAMDLQLEATWKQVNETSKVLKEYLKKRSKSDDEWGRFLEEMCVPATIEIFKNEGIDITQRYTGITHAKDDDGEEMEVDVILCNTTEAVAIEVKSSCEQKHIDHFLHQLKVFKKVFHPFDKYTVYAAIVGMKFQNGIKKYARNQGLYVIECTAEGVFTLAMKPDLDKRLQVEDWPRKQNDCV